MQCNENNIIDLNALNKRVDANKARKAKAARRRSAKLCVYQLLLVAVFIAILVLECCKVISVPFSVAALSVITNAVCLLAGYHLGITKK